MKLLTSHRTKNIISGHTEILYKKSNQNWMNFQLKIIHYNHKSLFYSSTTKTKQNSLGLQNSSGVYVYQGFFKVFVNIKLHFVQTRKMTNNKYFRFIKYVGSLPRCTLHCT